jgi:hypothetical protein
MYYFLDYFFTKRSNIKKNSLQLIFHIQLKLKNNHILKKYIFQKNAFGEQT